MTVWTLETQAEEEAIEAFQYICTLAMEGDKDIREYLTQVWDGESWESIARKLEVEGSTHYVWEMDGVRRFMADTGQLLRT